METEESVVGLFRTLIIAIIAIYFLSALLFNSVTQPFLVMFAIPFGIAGVIIAFVLHQEPFSFMGIMGIIGLSGVVVNDSLVLVNHINEQRKLRPGESVKKLVSESTADRLRAIIMTALTNRSCTFTIGIRTWRNCTFFRLLWHYLLVGDWFSLLHLLSF